ncbi:putative signaling protein [Rhodocyclaceae bacterium]|nr:putative signaling protein [Rhodocyclaceae bacterium]
MMRFGISNRLWLATALVAVLPLIVLQQALTAYVGKVMHESIVDHLKLIARSKMAQIEELIGVQQKNIQILAQMRGTRNALKEIDPLFRKGTNAPAYRLARQRYLDMIDNIGNFESVHDVFLIDTSGEVLLTHMEEHDLGASLFSGPLSNTPLSKVVHEALYTLGTSFSDYAWYAPSAAEAAFIATPVMEGSHLLGVLVVQISQRSVNKLTGDYSGLGETGEIVIVERAGDDTVVVAPLRNVQAKPLQMKFSRNIDVPMHLALDGETGVGIRTDYRGKEVLAAWSYLPRAGWGIVVKIDTDEVFKPVRRMQQWSVGVLIALLALTGAVALWLGRSIALPVNVLTRVSGEIAAGNLDKRISYAGNDELGDLAGSFNRMADSLEQTQNALLDERQHLEDTVQQRTIELESTNVHLLQEIADHKVAKAEVLLAQTVYQSMTQGVMVTDSKRNIISVNPAFIKITGFGSAEVIGRKPGFNRSGYHDAAFYSEMWQAISEDGHWEGEIWDRRKDGESFPQWLAISVVRDEQGAVLHYIGVFSDITEQKKSQEKIHYQANYDELTHLPNRRLFYDRMEQDIRKAHRDSTQIALLFIDLDNFKEINDTLGHEQGDQLLRETAQRLRACVRETDTVARLGGDEFTVILPDVQTSSEVEGVAQKIIQSLILPFTLGDNKGYVSASVGITIYPLDGDNYKTLLKNADQAMYEAKRLGKNRFSYFTSAMQQASQERMLLSNELRMAVQQGQFEMYFQPVHDFSTGEVVKAEALIRWRHPQRGLVGPATFITLAEEVGLIGEIGEFAFASSVQQLQAWMEKVPYPMTVAINLSPRQISGQANFEGWIDTMRATGMATDLVTLEITEGSLLEENLSVQRKLRRLREAGFKIAIDDFGTGYSSLSYLKKFDIDFLKIDQSFIRDLATDPNDRALVEAIIVMAHKLGIEVIAEGCETAAQHNVLVQAGCDFIQGYFYARPMPSQDFIRYLGMPRRDI